MAAIRLKEKRKFNFVVLGLLLLAVGAALYGYVPI
jgi:hypothetical protein